MRQTMSSIYHSCDETEPERGVGLGVGGGGGGRAGGRVCVGGGRTIQGGHYFSIDRRTIEVDVQKAARAPSSSHDII